MQLFASTRGSFLEPFDAENTTDDLVSFLQFEAHTLQETQVLRDIYRIIRRGGVLRVRRDVSGFYIHTDLLPQDGPSEGASSDTGISHRGLETKNSHRRKKLAAFPLLAPSAREGATWIKEREHRHFFTAKVASIPDSDADGTWLSCACGAWEYFARRGPGTLVKETPKGKLN